MGFHTYIRSLHICQVGLRGLHLGSFASFLYFSDQVPDHCPEVLEVTHKRVAILGIPEACGFHPVYRGVGQVVTNLDPYPRMTPLKTKLQLSCCFPRKDTKKGTLKRDTSI